jgi:hypothetical protein
LQRRRNAKFELLKANAIGKQKDWIKKWVLHLADNYSYRRREKALEIPDQIRYLKMDSAQRTVKIRN